MTREEFVCGGHQALSSALQEKRSTIFYWTKGAHKKIPLHRLQALAARIGVDIETLSEWLEARYQHYKTRSKIRDRLKEGA